MAQKRSFRRVAAGTAIALAITSIQSVGRVQAFGDSSPTLITQGTIENINPTDTTVTAFAWPSNETLTNAPIGTEFDLTPLATSGLSASGSFSLYESSSVDLAPVINEFGDINLSVLAATPSLSVVANGSYSSSSPLASSPATLPAWQQPEFGVNVNAASGEPRPTGPTVQGASAPENVNESPGHIDNPLIGPQALTKARACYRLQAVKRADLTPTMGIVGQSFSGTTKGTAKFSYTTSGSTNIGIATSVSGGGFKATSGTTRVSKAGATMTYPTNYGFGNYFWQTKFNQAKFEIRCINPRPHAPSEVYTHHWEVRATSIFGGQWSASTTARSGATAANCGAFPSGAILDINRSRAITWTNGLDSSGIIGSDVSTQTGYSVDNTLTYTSSGNLKACGNGGGPASTTATTVAIHDMSTVLS